MQILNQPFDHKIAHIQFNKILLPQMTFTLQRNSADHSKPVILDANCMIVTQNRQKLIEQILFWVIHL